MTITLQAVNRAHRLPLRAQASRRSEEQKFLKLAKSSAFAALHWMPAIKPGICWQTKMLQLAAENVALKNFCCKTLHLMPTMKPNLDGKGQV